MTPWREKELRRHQTLRDTHDPNIIKSGLEFFEYNLAALKHLDTNAVLKTGGVELKEWLELLGNAHMKTKDEIQSDVTMAPVKKAYQLIESSTLPDNIHKEYEEAQKKRFQIKHYVSDEKSKSKAEGKAEGKIEGEKAKAIEIARNLKSMNLSIDQIKTATGLTEEEIKAIN